MKIKKPFLFLLFLIFLFSIFVLNIQLAFAQEEGPRRLEITYPKFPEFYTPETVEFPVPDYVKYIYNFAILAGGLIALGVLVFAGFKYLTSAGSPGKISDAKNQIASALLGLLILFGSYLLLESINPNLVIFHLRGLPPIISELAPGVLLCKEQPAVGPEKGGVMGLWDKIGAYRDLSQEYEELDVELKDSDWGKKFLNDLKARKKLIEEMFKDISKKCYMVRGADNIISDFDNKVRYVYFIPGEEPIVEEINGEKETIYYMVHYGAILYEKRNFNGAPFHLYRHLTYSDVGYKVVEERVGVAEEGGIYVAGEGLRTGKFSSIRPFMTKYIADENWEVILYEQANRNAGFGEEAKKVSYKLPIGKSKYWFREVALGWPPRSMEITGDLLAILYKSQTISPAELPGSVAFFSGIENDLEQYYQIIHWIPCKEYIAKYGHTTKHRDQPLFRKEYCADAAADTLFILNAVPY